MTALLSNAATPLLDVFGFSPESHYGNGANLYQFAASNPVMGRDPLGLFDYFDEIDDIIGNIGAEKAAAMTVIGAQVGMFVNTASLIGGMAFSFLPGADAITMAIMLAAGQDLTWDILLGAGLSLAGPAGKMVGAHWEEDSRVREEGRTEAAAQRRRHGPWNRPSGSALQLLRCGDAGSDRRGSVAD